MSLHFCFFVTCSSKYLKSYWKFPLLSQGCTCKGIKLTRKTFLITQYVFSLTYFKQKRHLWQPFLDERKGYCNLDLFCLRTITVISYIRLKNIIYKQFLSFLAHRILRKGFLPAINHGEFQIIFCILDQPVNFHQSK